MKLVFALIIARQRVNWCCHRMVFIPVNGAEFFGQISVKETL